MSKSPERITSAQRALIETTQTIGQKALDSAVELLQLNLQATQLAASPAVEQMKSVAQPNASQGRRADAPGTNGYDPSLVLAYHRQVLDIASRGNSEIMPLLIRQASEFQSLMNELFSTAISSTPSGADAYSTMFRTPFEAMQRTMEQASAAITRAAATAAEVASAGAHDEGGGTGARAASRKSS